MNGLSLKIVGLLSLATTPRGVSARLWVGPGAGVWKSAPPSAAVGLVITNALAAAMTGDTEPRGVSERLWVGPWAAVWKNAPPNAALDLVITTPLAAAMTSNTTQPK